MGKYYRCEAMTLHNDLTSQSVNDCYSNSKPACKVPDLNQCVARDPRLVRGKFQERLNGAKLHSLEPEASVGFALEPVGARQTAPIVVFWRRGVEWAAGASKTSSRGAAQKASVTV